MWRCAWALLGLILCGCAAIESHSEYQLDGPVPLDREGFSNALYQATGVELVPGNQVEVVNNGEIFDVLAKDLAGAQRSINIVLFIWRPGDPSDRLLPIITERARAGVECRVLADALASVDFKGRIQPTLEEAGCQVRLARKEVTIARNHRKIIVIDGELGFTGGVGVYKSWVGNGRRHGEWRDTNVRVQGPVVAQLQQAFAANWVEETGTLMPRTQFPPLEAKGATPAAFVASEASEHVTKAERLSHLAISAAKRRVWIGNAYFVPSPGLIDLLRQKRLEGVDVRVMTSSEETDHPEVLALGRRHYPPLLEAGVRIFEYQPAMYHSKTMLVDDEVTVVGSINFDKLSQAWLDEGSLVIFDRAFAKQMERDWEQDEQHCREAGR